MSRPMLVDRQLNGLQESLAFKVFNESKATNELLNQLERVVDNIPQKQAGIDQRSFSSTNGSVVKVSDSKKVNLNVLGFVILILGSLGMYFLYKLKEIEKKTPPKSNWFDMFTIQPYNQSSVDNTFSYF